MRTLPLCGFLLAASIAWAHPMGNFSVSHYSRIDLAPNESHLLYVLDLAEIPTFELFQEWNVEPADRATINAKAHAQAEEWLRNLSFRAAAERIHPKLRRVTAVTTDGAGGMPVLRVAIDAALPAAAGELEYEDTNYQTRAGWKEIVIRTASSVKIEQATHGARDVSQALTQYPTDQAFAPPQDLRASVRWTPIVIAPHPPAAPSIPAPVVKPFAASQPTAPGSVTRGDFLSRFIQGGVFTWSTILIALAAAFGLGAIHAMSPGHGKTIVAAYLVGARGTLKHAILLGGTVTFTHTISVFLLGLGVLFFQQYVVPERIIPTLSAASGLSIVAVGMWLFYRRVMTLSQDHHHHDHDHDHAHHHHHGFSHTHTHDGHTHTHVIPDEKLNMAGLLALGASGGLVPCPSALILMLGAIAVRQTALGLGLLLSFSLGLAIVLMAIGAIVLYARNLLPENISVRSHPVFRFVPVFSAAVVTTIGLLMTLAAVGWLKPPVSLG